MEEFQLSQSKLLILISIVCFIFLFASGPNYYSTRSIKYAWDLGHIFFFSVFTYLLLNTKLKILKAPFVKQCLVVLLLVFIFGILTELAQVLFNRTFSIGDLIKDLTGSLITLAFISQSRKMISKYKLRILQSVILLIVIFEIAPLAIALTDEMIASKQFPVLSDFETPFEIKRWTGDTDISRDNSASISGNYSLKVPLNTTKYSGVHLEYFPGDWRRYKCLEFSIFNPSPEDLKITCRVHDESHVFNGQRYDDRFNKSFILSHGKNDIIISFDKIINAPVLRKMDMGHIKGLSIFSTDLTKQEVIYIDNVRLIK